MINKILNVTEKTLSDIGTIGLLTLGFACILYVFKWWTLFLVLICLTLNIKDIIQKSRNKKNQETMTKLSKCQEGTFSGGIEWDGTTNIDWGIKLNSGWTHWEQDGTLSKPTSNYDKCPNCNSQLYDTYDINDNENDPNYGDRIFGVICSQCGYEHYDNED